VNDEGLHADRGSGWPWHGGWICGLSVAWRDGGEIRANYIPLRHPNSNNFDPVTVVRWLNDLIAAGVRFVTMNGSFDWAWLASDGDITMPPSDRLEEVGALAALVDENQLKYGLDALCARHGLPGNGAAGGSLQSCGLQDHQKDPGAILHLAIAGGGLRPVW
jgi:hypothetical protein